MEYIAAEWVIDEAMGTRNIKAIGDDGSIWWIPSLDCDVPPFPAFLQSAAGKEFLAKSIANEIPQPDAPA